jgi:FkbM family methyltransferase
MKQTIKRWRDNSPLMEPMCRLLRATGMVPARLWHHLPFTGTADFLVAGNRVRMNHFGAEIENSLFWAGFGADWEGTTLLAWERLAIGQNVIFDVGANTGLFAVAAKAVSPQAKVHAFEPLPAIADRLRANVALNGFDVTVHAAAVSDSDGTAEIKLMQADHEYSASFEHMDWMDTAEAISVEVPLIRLASVIAQSGDRPDLIKIDVERHEPQALRGLWPALVDGPMPAIVIEILDDESAAAVAAEVSGKGYRTYVIREGVGIEEDTIRFVPGTMNWLLLPKGMSGPAGELAAQLAAKGRISHAELSGMRPRSHSQPRNSN